MGSIVAVTRTLPFILNPFVVEVAQPSLNQFDTADFVETTRWDYHSLTEPSDTYSAYSPRFELELNTNGALNGVLDISTFSSSDDSYQILYSVSPEVDKRKLIEFRDPITRKQINLERSQFNEEYILDLIQRFETYLYEIASCYLPTGDSSRARCGAQFMMGMIENGSLYRTQMRVLGILSMFSKYERSPDQFSILSHHLKNILTIIIGRLSLIESAIDTSRSIQFIHDMAKGMDQTVSPSSILSRLSSLLSEIYKLEKHRQGIDATFVRERHSGDEEELQVPFNPLFQVLQELIWNACKYSEVSVRVGYEPDTRTFYITNDGEQIPAGVDVFAAGVRSTQRNVEGTGFGLAGVRELCLKHGWKLSYRSNSQGTIFQVKV